MKNVKSALIVFAGIVVATVGYGFKNGGAALDLLTKDQNGVIQLATKTNQVNLASSTNVSLGSTTLTKCVTATWNPGSIGSSTNATAGTSTDISFAGAVTSDICMGSLTSGTTTVAAVNCNITGTATATVRLYNTGNVALDLATGTARACIFK